MTAKHANDRLQYEFSEPLGGDCFDLTYIQGGKPGQPLRVYIAPELRQHVSPEAVASCLYDACTMYKTHGVPEPVKVAVGTPDGLVTILVTFGDADSQPAQVSCDWGGISKGLVRIRE